jgi:DNA polymerase
MQSQAETAEFLSLLAAAREQLNYLKELGVERMAKTDLSVSAATDAGSPAGATRAQASPVPFKAFNASEGVISKPATPQTDVLFSDLSSEPLRLAKSSESFEEIWADVGDCTRCPLHQGRTNIVHTDGNRRARLMFVGEAPGADEDAQSRPFVGRAGQLLTKIIEAIGFKREEVLIGNVNRCRPPSNRPPTPEEASMCKPFLLREIAVVQPEVIVVLGNTAMRNLLDIRQGITKVRGEFQDYHGVKVMPTFHPAYLLRDPSKKKETWEDLKKVRDYLDTTRKPAS